MSNGIIVQSIIRTGYVPSESLCAAILRLLVDGIHGSEANCECGRRLLLFTIGEKTVVSASVPGPKEACRALEFLEPND